MLLMRWRTCDEALAVCVQQAAGFGRRRASHPTPACRLLHSQGAILGRDKVGLKFNIPGDKLQEVRRPQRGWAVGF